MSLMESGEGGKKKRRAKPTLVKIGNRTVISSGQYHLPTVADYILPRSLPSKGFPKGRWLSLAEMAALKGSGADPTAKKQARRMIPGLAAYLLDNHNRVLIYEYEGRRISRVKVYDPESSTEDERQEARHKLDRMKDRRDLDVQRYERARVIMGDSLLDNVAFPQKGSGGESEAS